MRNLLFSSVALLALSSFCHARADSWAPFANKRVGAPDGRSYVVVRSTKGFRLSYELCARRDGALPLPDAEELHYARGLKRPGIARDPKDRLLAKGTLPQLPLDVTVLDGGRGFVLFDRHGGVGRGQVLTYVGADGKVVFTYTLVEVFGRVPPKSMFTVSSTWWNESFWIDQKKRSAMLVAKGDELREVSLDDGTVTVPTLERLIEACEDGSPKGQAAVLDLLARRKDKRSFTAAVQLATSLARDKRSALGVRLRAALLLKRNGRETDYAELFLRACKATTKVDIRRYAVLHLGDILGTDAMPHWRRMMRGKASPVWGACQHGFASLGEKAIPTLVEMLEEQGQTPDYRGGAAHALAKIDSAKALPALQAVIENETGYVANAARGAVRAIRARKTPR